MDGIKVLGLQDHKSVAVVGLGETGYSVIRFLQSQGKDVYAMDQSESPSCLTRIQQLLSADRIQLGGLDDQRLQAVDLIVVSPGVNLLQPVFENLRKSNKIIYGDVELFCQINTVPIIAVTGSNGKTTVTTMIVQALLNSGKKVIAAGNIGVPVLDILSSKDLDYVVLELSSFQLQSLYSLRAEVAVVLNFTPDHLDRHENMEDYYQAKLRIYTGAKHAVCNRDLLLSEIQQFKTFYTFGGPLIADFCITDGAVMFRGELVCQVASWLLHGKHHYQNALALIAIIYTLQLPLAAAVTVLQNFTGIEHRCQKVAEINGVSWYNDSKATNEGACIAAVQTLASQFDGRMILLLGGDSKGASFSEIKTVVDTHASVVITFGMASDRLAGLLASVVKVYQVESMSAAVSLANKLSYAQDIVLLSPACASFDMFDNYKHRGDMFVKYVQEVSV